MATTSCKNGDAPYGSAKLQPIKLTSTAKFKNTKALADYLILLDKNDTLYITNIFGGNLISKCKIERKRREEKYVPLMCRSPR